MSSQKECKIAYEKEVKEFVLECKDQRKINELCLS